MSLLKNGGLRSVHGRTQTSTPASQGRGRRSTRGPTPTDPSCEKYVKNSTGAVAEATECLNDKGVNEHASLSFSVSLLFAHLCCLCSSAWLPGGLLADFDASWVRVGDVDPELAWAMRALHPRMQVKPRLHCLGTARPALQELGANLFHLSLCTCFTCNVIQLLDDRIVNTITSWSAAAEDTVVTKLI